MVFNLQIECKSEQEGADTVTGRKYETCQCGGQRFSEGAFHEADKFHLVQRLASWTPHAAVRLDLTPPYSQTLPRAMSPPTLTVAKMHDGVWFPRVMRNSFFV